MTPTHCPPGVGIRRGSEVVALDQLHGGSTGVVVGEAPDLVTGNVWVCWGSAETVGSPIPWHPSQLALDLTTTTGQQHAALWLLTGRPLLHQEPGEMRWAETWALRGRADPDQLRALMWRVWEAGRE